MGAHILVVDDHRDIRDALGAYLRKNDLRVSTAADAAAARSALGGTKQQYGYAHNGFLGEFTTLSFLEYTGARTPAQRAGSHG